MKLIVEDIPLEILAYPMSSDREVTDLRKLRRIIFHASPKELNRRDFFLHQAYIISTIPAISQRYESTSKLERPAVRSPKVNNGEKPKEAEDMAA
jgi:hypothetical protein